MLTLRHAPLPPDFRLHAAASAAWARGEEAHWLEGGGAPEITTHAYLAIGPPRAVVEGNDAAALAALEQELARVPRVVGDPAELAGFPFHGGAIGFLAYECNQFFERVPAARERIFGLPLLRWMFPSRLVCARANAAPMFIGISENDSEAEFAASLEELLRAAYGIGHVGPRPADRNTTISLGWPRERYVTSAARILEHVRAGDIYQGNLSQPFSASAAPDPLETHKKLLATHPTPFAAFLGFGERAIVSASPELFLRRRGARLETRPIKGTRPRTGDAAADAAALADLAASEKDKAELAMIVDLERNDLSRVCRAGTVAVPRAREIETYGTVFHGVATVTGELRPGVRFTDLLAAAFPSGSITGCPKIRAMEILHGLEREPRGPSFGAVGWIGYDGNCDLNVAIRTMSFARERGAWNATFRTGGGIVADSDPDAEYQESLVKARALARALGDEDFG
jgi:para-aminobenzoate synthetase component 1